MRRGRRGAHRKSGSGARSRFALAEVGGGWWRFWRMLEAGPERPPQAFTNLHQPRPASHMPPLRDAALERVPGPGGLVVSALERRDVQRDGRQVVEQDRPWRERAHRG